MQLNVSIWIYTTPGTRP